MSPPWARPFSMKMRFASRPDARTPAMNTPGTFVCIVAGSCCGTPVFSSTVTPPAHHHDTLPPVRVRLGEEVGYVREVLPGHTERIRRVKVSGCKHDVACAHPRWRPVRGAAHGQLEA